LDPACGCGNFLVISYRELRLLELEVLRASHRDGQQMLDVNQLISLNVDQFYGIEIEEFPAQIAQVALWLADHQMNLRVSEEFGLYFARIPLKSTPHVVHGNALALDWKDVLPAQRCSYVLGNPPFVGAKFMSDAQREDARLAFNGIDNAGLLDFVAAWYVKATQYLQPVVPRAGVEPARPRCAFVSTNSITQGEQVGVLWGWLLAQGVHIHFAHRTFSWSNEAKGKAAVHCVIVGFGLDERPDKTLYEYEDIKGEPLAVPAKNINPYLVDAANMLLSSRREPIGRVPQIAFGNMPNDGGNLLLSDEEKHVLLQAEPDAARWIRSFLGAHEFINSTPRWCLWLRDIPPAELRNLPLVARRVAAVKGLRQESSRATTRELAAYPALFGEIRQPIERYILVPRHSSESRAYIPFGFVDPHVICGDSNMLVPSSDLAHFGMMQSSMHMAWLRTVGGRLKSDYRYSAGIVYNNFPWPEIAGPSTPAAGAAYAQGERSRGAIEAAAQAVLDARAQFPDSTLADLYDPLTMPPPLVKAHQQLDKAVDAAYVAAEKAAGRKAPKLGSDAERVAFLFERYQALTSLLPAAKATRRPRKAQGVA
jgi:hypothetical protein